MDRQRATGSEAPDREAQPAPVAEPQPAAVLAANGSRSPASLLALQQSAGNQAVGRVIARQPTAPAPSTAPTEPFELGGYHIATYGDAALVFRAWGQILDEEAKALTDGGLAVPPSVDAAKQRGLTFVQVLEGGGTEPLDRGNADDMRAYYTNTYVPAINAARGVQADEVATRARIAARDLKEVQDKLEAMVPTLRDVQRAKFRGGDEDGLLATADAIANVLDTGLVVKQSYDAAVELASDLRMVAGTGAGKGLMDIAGKAQTVLEVLEKIDKAWAVFQLARAAVDLVSGGKTEAAGGHAAVSAMATTMSAGGTLLGASAGFTLYSNLYIGPMTAACLNMLTKVEDLISKGDNRNWMEVSDFDMVNWSLEPGGRPMFDFMLALMHAESVDAVPMPPAKVREYMVDQEDDINAGVGHKGEDLPTEGHWFWRKTENDKIKGWAFTNRDNLWGMLYGAAKVPSGRREL
jgi:hypothetical protein